MASDRVITKVTVNWDSKVMELTFGEVNVSTSGTTLTAGSIQTATENATPIQVYCFDNFEIDTVTNTNTSVFTIKNIDRTAGTFIFTYVDGQEGADIIDTITITTRAIGSGDSPTNSENITNLTGTTWRFNDTINGYDIIELVPTFPGDYYESSITLFNISYTFDGVTYNCLHAWPTSGGTAEPWDGNMIYYPGWNTTVREITFIGGNDATDDNLLNFMKSNATLVSGGDSGDEPGGGDEPSTPTIGPNTQLTEFLTGIADALREKKGTSDLINPQNFAQEITDLSTGGGSEDDLLDKLIEGTLIGLSTSNISALGNGTFRMNNNLLYVDLPNCSKLGTQTFAQCSKLISVNLPVLPYVSDYMFISCINLRDVRLPNCSYIGSYAFSGCSNLVNIDLPNCSHYLHPYAFQNCINLQTISLPLCTSIGLSCFGGCSNLKSISLPNCTNINNWAFSYCSNLSSIYIPKMTSLSGCFGNCGVETIDMPQILSLSGTFSNCYKLSYVNLPNCTYLNTYAFSGCSKLTYISLPACQYISGTVFSGCSNLQTISLPMCSYLGYSTFYNCSKLSSIYLMSNSIVSIYNSQIFMNTPMQYSSYLGYFGSIYVPNSLLASYKANTYWSYYSSRFVGV